MYETCWDILGLEPTADVSAIKSAYATKLKFSRPEVDPLAFQTLREARDAAMMSSQSFSPEIAVPIFLPTETPIPFDGGDDAFVNKTARKSSTVTRPNPKKSTYVRNTQSSLTAFANWIAAFDNLHSAVQIEAVLTDLKSASLVERRRAEAQLIDAIEANFEKRIQQGSSHAHLSWNEPFNDAILKIDEEFGWANRDRALLGHAFAEGENLADRLQNLRKHKTIFAPVGKVFAKPKWKFAWWQWIFFLYLFGKLILILVSI
jgi:hypothetical protein